MATKKSLLEQGVSTIGKMVEEPIKKKEQSIKNLVEQAPPVGQMVKGDVTGNVGKTLGLSPKKEEWEKVTFEEPPASPTESMTTAEKAQALLENDVVETAEAGKKLFGDDWKGTSTWDEAMKDFITSQKEQKEYTEKQLKAQQEADIYQTGKFKNAAEASVEGITASLAQGREGVTSSTTPTVIKEYDAAVQADIGMAIKSYESAQAERDNILKNLDAAQKAGQDDLAKQYQNALVAKELQIQQAQTNMLEAQSRSVELAMNVQNQKLNAVSQFQGMVDTGAEFTTEGLIGMAETMGLDFKTVYSYYEATKSIRDDKKLDQQEKTLALEQLNLELEREARGVVNGQLQNIDYLEGLYKKGASQEEISRAKAAMGIPDELDPMYQIELKTAEAELKIKNIEAQYAGGPPPVGTMDWIKYQQEKLILQEMAMEQSNLYMFTPGDVSVSEVEGKAGSNSMLTYKNMYAGSSANTKGPDFSAPVGTPISSHISGKVISVISDGGYGPDSGWGNQIKIQDANGFIHQFSHLNPGSINVQVGTVVTPGMQIAQVGSTGHVMSGGGKSYSAAEAQSGAGSHLDYTVYDSNNKPVGLEQSTKFAFGESVPGGQSKNMVNQILLLAKRQGDKKEIQPLLESYMAMEDKKPLQDFVNTLVFDDYTASQKDRLSLRAGLVDVGKDVVAKMKAFEEAGGKDFGIFNAAQTKVMNKINKLPSQEQQMAAQQLLGALEDFARAQTGAAIADSEVKRFEDIMPTIFDGSELVEAKILALSENQQIMERSAIKRRLGDTLYEQIYGNGQAAKTPDKSPAKIDRLWEAAAEDVLYTPDKSFYDQWENF